MNIKNKIAFLLILSFLILPGLSAEVINIDQEYNVSKSDIDSIKNRVDEAESRIYSLEQLEGRIIQKLDGQKIFFLGGIILGCGLISLMNFFTNMKLGKIIRSELGVISLKAIKEETPKKDEKPKTEELPKKEGTKLEKKAKKK